MGEIKKIRGLWRLSLKGRLKTMILGACGENIYPEDIEFVLNQHPLVQESLVVEDDNGLVALLNVDEEKLSFLFSFQPQSILSCFFADTPG